MRKQNFKVLAHHAVPVIFKTRSGPKTFILAVVVLMFMSLLLPGLAVAAGFEDDNPLKDESDESTARLKKSEDDELRPEQIDESLLSDAVQQDRDDSGSGFFFPAFFAGVAQNDMPVAPPAQGNTSLWAYDFRLKFGYEVFESSSTRIEIFASGLLSYPIRIRDEVGRPLLEAGVEVGGVFRFLPFSVSLWGLNFDGELISSLGGAASQIQHARHLLNTLDAFFGACASFASERYALIERPVYLDLSFRASGPLGAYSIREAKPLDRSDLAYEDVSLAAWNSKGTTEFYEFGAQLSTQVSAIKSGLQPLGQSHQNGVNQGFSGASSRLGVLCFVRQRVYKGLRIEDETKADSKRSSLALGFVWERKLQP